MKKLTILMAVIAACLTALSSANSPFVYTQGVDNAATSPGIVTDSFLGGPGPAGQSAADNFTLAPATSDYIVTGVTVWGARFDNNSFTASNPNTGGFSMPLNFLTNSGSNLPQTLIAANLIGGAASIVTSTSNGTVSGFSSYRVDFDLTSIPVNLGTGGTYWLGFGGEGSGISFLWNYSTVNNGSAFVNTAGGWNNWQVSNPPGLAFEIRGYSVDPVPEPATMAIAALALPFLKRRKK